MNEAQLKMLAQIVKDARGNLSQRAYAKRIGVSYTTVQAWEKGKAAPDIENLGKIANSAGMEFQELLARLGNESRGALILTVESWEQGQVGSQEQGQASRPWHPYPATARRVRDLLDKILESEDLTVEDTEKIKNLTDALRSLSDLED